MPLYEYACNTCRGHFEVLVRGGAAESRPACPDCGSVEVRKLLSLVATRPARGSELPMSRSTAADWGGGGGGCGCGSCGCH